MISQSQARALAEQHSRVGLGDFAYAAARVLRDDFLEAEHCWMYFMSDAYVQPEDAAPGVKYAHVVSKQGNYARVPDVSDDAAKLQASLQAISQQFGATR